MRTSIEQQVLRGLQQQVQPGQSGAGQQAGPQVHLEVQPQLSDPAGGEAMGKGGVLEGFNDVGQGKVGHERGV